MVHVGAAHLTSGQPEQALPWLSRAAAEGDMLGALNLALLLEASGNPQGRRLEQAWAGGDPVALCNLGLLVLWSTEDRLRSWDAS